MKTISVIIPSYNSAQTIEFVLKALLNQTRQEQLIEVFVVDSSDDQKTKQVLAPYEKGIVKIIHAGVRVFPGAGRDIGARQATGDILLFLDADAYPAPDYIEMINPFLEQGVLAGGGSISLPEFQRTKLLPLIQYFFQSNEFMKAGKPRVKEFLPSCNMFCERKLFAQVGGFGPIRAAEDVLIGLALSKVTPIWFIPQATAYHIYRDEFKSSFINQMLLGEYVIRYRRSEFNKFFYQGIWPLLFLPGFLVIKFFRITRRVFQNTGEMVLKYILILPFIVLSLLIWGVGFARGCVGEKAHG